MLKFYTQSIAIKKEFIKKYFSSILSQKSIEVAYVSQLGPESCLSFWTSQVKLLIESLLSKKCSNKMFPEEAGFSSVVDV